MILNDAMQTWVPFRGWIIQQTLKGFYAYLPNDSLHQVINGPYDSIEKICYVIKIFSP